MYISSLDDELPDFGINMYRYPKRNSFASFSHLDYSKPEERKQIVNILIRMREKN